MNKRIRWDNGDYQILWRHEIGGRNKYILNSFIQISLYYHITIKLSIV